ncbi:MoaD/ThiS family protein [Chloroflexota bacterium]
MSITININPSMTHLTEGQEVLEVQGSNVGQCLEQLVARFPEVKTWLYDKDGKLQNFIEIYVNLMSAYPEELAKPVKDGDELHVVAQVAGG